MATKKATKKVAKTAVRPPDQRTLKRIADRRFNLGNYGLAASSQLKTNEQKGELIESVIERAVMATLVGKQKPAQIQKELRRARSAALSQYKARNNKPNPHKVVGR